MLKRLSRVLTYACLLFASNALWAEIPYDIAFDGTEDREILSTLRSVSELEKRRDQPPLSGAALRERAESDSQGLLRALRGLGYYDAEVETAVDMGIGNALVTIHIELGTLYCLADFQVLSVSDRDPPFPEQETWLIQPDPDLDLSAFDPDCLGIELGTPAVARRILRAQDQLIRQLASQGYPLAGIMERDAVADQAEKTLSVTLYLNSGPLLTFGPTDIVGLESVCDEAVERKIRWCEGDIFDIRLVEETQDRLTDSRLFAISNIGFMSESIEGGELPMEIDLKEAKHRTIGFGAGYQTNRGLGVSGMWEHRNMRGMGEKLSLRGSVKKLDQFAEVSYRIPDWLRCDQDLIFLAEVEHEQTEGYTETMGRVGATVETQVSDCFRTWYGATIKQQRVKEHPGRIDSNTLLSFPSGLRYDTTDDPLDPSCGYTVLFKSNPNVALSDVNINFVTHELMATTYYQIANDPLFILALKGHWGGTWGVSRLDIPAPERFYAGSANSLRGYGYRSVGPVNNIGTPTGGRSLMVYSAEGRWRITDSIGLVGFFDIGNVFEDAFPRFDRKLLRSIGTGIRYHTPIGPFRIDIAHPLDRRPGLDDKYELYMSIGQAF